MTKTSLLAKTIPQLNTLKEVRGNVDLDRLFLEINKKGDLGKKAKELNIKSGALNRAISEKRINNLIPDIQPSKAAILSWLKTDKEVLLFSRKYDLKDISARKLKMIVRDWNRELQTNPDQLLSEKQQDLIIGSTIGDANIRQRNRNCSFRVSHTKKQKEYLLSKYRLINEFTNLGPHYMKKTIKNGRVIYILEISTFTHYIFNYYRKLFYKNDKKIITRKILNLLNPRSLAYWICDDGNYGTKQDYIILCTNAFTLKEHKIMKKYFN